MPVRPIIAVDRGQIHPRDHVQHTPCQLVWPEPLTQTRRHQQHLITITQQKVLSHTRTLLNPPDRNPPLRDSLTSAIFGRL